MALKSNFEVGWWNCGGVGRGNGTDFWYRMASFQTQPVFSFSGKPREPRAVTDVPGPGILKMSD